MNNTALAKPMATIQKIKRIQGIGVFRDFSWSVGLEDFQTYNLIYGLNGSGKTTLSNIFRCLELKQCVEGNFTVTANGGDISSNVLSTHPALPQVKVFNRDFLIDNVFTSFGTCCPIFFLGEDSVEKRKQIDEKNLKAGSLQTAMAQAEFEHASTKKTLEDLRTATAGKIKELLRSAGSNNTYNTYDKRNFTSKCEYLKTAATRPKLLSEAEKEQCKAAAAGTAKDEISEIQFTIPNLVDIKTATEVVLARTVVSEVIDTLKSLPRVNTWVEQGLRLHKELELDLCQFCEGPLPDGRIKTLNKHFSGEYEAVANLISNARASIAAHLATIGKLTFPDTARVYDDFAEPYRLALGDIIEAKGAIEGFLKNCDSALQRKQGNLFETITFVEAVPATMVPEGLNKQIRAHNARTRNFQGAIAEARTDLENTIVSETLDQVFEIEGGIAAAAEKVSTLRATIDSIRNEVLKLDREIKEHHRPADQINADLACYLGRKDITLDVEDGGYRIMRDGIPATKLSEGEKNALAVIYFLKSLEDRGFDKATGIVVIDDPVSSLDANALFYAFSFIRERTKGVGQLFITTHNFSFLRLVRKWFFRIHQKRKQTKLEMRMYMIACRGSSSGRRAELAALDPLLSNYDSEYSYLFSQVLKGAGECQGDIEKFYHYPNIARRVLEAFLSFRLPGSALTWGKNNGKSDMHSSLHELGFDPAKTNRMLDFLNAHSHNARPDGSVDHDESILLETPAVLKDVLDLIKNADVNHYAGMMELIISPASL